MRTSFGVACSSTTGSLCVHCVFTRATSSSNGSMRFGLGQKFFNCFRSHQAFATYFFLQLQKPSDKGLWPWGTTRHIHVDRNNAIHTFHHMVSMLPIGTATISARPHRYHITGLSH